MVQRFAAAARRLNGDLNIFFDALLADVLVQALRTDAGLDARVLVKRRAGDDSVGLSLRHHAFCTCVRHLFTRRRNGKKLNTEFTEIGARRTQRKPEEDIFSLSLCSLCSLCPLC